SGPSGVIRTTVLPGASAPHCEGKERDGPTPRPTQVRGQHSVGYFRGRMNRLSDDSAAAHRPLEGEGRERSERGGVNAERDFCFTPPRPPRYATLRRSTLPSRGGWPECAVGFASARLRARHQAPRGGLALPRGCGLN